MRKHTEQVSAAAEQLGTEVARNGPCHAGLLGVDTAEAIERADIGERVCEEVSTIRWEGAVRALDRSTTASDYANPERRTGHDHDAQDATTADIGPECGEAVRLTAPLCVERWRCHRGDA